MRKYYSFFVLIVILLALQSNSYAQWIITNPLTQSDSLNCVTMVSSSTGWAVGNKGIIIKTTNGGTSWTELNSGATSDLESVFFIDENNGTVVGRDGIIRTTDGGTTWTQSSGDATFLNAVSFSNGNIGVAVGSSGRIFRTTDGGASWNQLTLQFTISSLYSVVFTDTNTGIAVGLNGTILKTTDGGEIWATKSSGTTSFLRGVSFSDTNNGTVVGSSGTVLRTNDGGENWTTQQASGVFLSVSFADENTGTIVGAGGKILRTTDGGTNWMTQTSSATAWLNSVYFVDANNGIIVGNDGLVLRTNNGGITAIENNSELSNKFILSQNYPNPFNPSTTISYSIPEASQVSLKIFDALGREVVELVNSENAAGNYELNFDAAQLSSGIYFYTLSAGKFRSTRKMILIK